MARKKTEDFTIVREHPRQVPTSDKNPSGVTIVDRHPRRLPGSYLNAAEIRSAFKAYDRANLTFPSTNNLGYKSGNAYDETIAVWVDYFNKKFRADSPIEPNVFKALIASESGFDKDPPGNKVALGITQITKSTLKILQDPSGEAKDFIFDDIRQKDLKEPDIAIPLGVRWLFKKKQTAAKKLKREPTTEELILEYKGLLKSKTALKEKALQIFRKHYDQLKNK